MLSQRLSILPVLLGCFLLSLSALAAELPDYIPAKTDAAIYMRTAELFQHPVLQPLMESGDLRRLRGELKMVPWGGGTTPDVILLYFSEARQSALLVQSPATIDELEKRWAPAAEQPNTTVSRYNRNGFPVLELKIVRPDKPGRDKIYSLVFLAPDIVLTTDSRDRIPWTMLDGEYSQKYKEELAQRDSDDLLFGSVNDPARNGCDPLGIGPGVNVLRFSLNSKGSAMQAQATAQCTDLKTAQRVRMQSQSIGQIMMVSFFGAEPKLFQVLNNALNFSTENDQVEVHADFTEDMVEAVRAYYANNTEKMNQLIQKSITTAQ